MNSGIEVFFTALDGPWGMATAGTPYIVNVYGPTGLVFLGPAPNGYLSIDLPPGTYVVTGNYTGYTIWPNNFNSNTTVVVVCCGRKACVKVVPRTFHECVWWAFIGAKVHLNNPHLAPNIAGEIKNAIAPLEKLLNAIPAEFHAPDFALAEGKTLLELKVPKGPPRKT